MLPDVIYNASSLLLLHRQAYKEGFHENIKVR